MLFARYVYSLIAVAGLTTAAAMAQTSTTTVTRSATLPAIGLGSSETAQVNVTNLAAASSSGAAASCTGTIAFLSASGSTIGSATPFAVTSGQTFSAKLPYASTAASGRTVVRGVVSLTTTSGTPCALATTLETYDTTTGATHAFFIGTEVDIARVSGGKSHSPRWAGCARFCELRPVFSDVEQSSFRGTSQNRRRIGIIGQK
jgi:hypothetical protein